MNGLRWTTIFTLVTALFLLTSCASNDVKIGVIIPQEGSLADYGYQIRSGIQMAYDEIQQSKQKGEIQKNYQLIMEREDQDLAKVEEAFHRLRKQGVTAIIGAASSAATLKLAPLANEHKIVLISPASSSPEINQGTTDFVFRNHPSDTLEAQKLSNVIFQKAKIQKCLMVRSRDAYSEGITFELLKFARQNSSSLPNEVVKFSANPEEVDWTAVVDRIVEIRPHAVFLAAYHNGLVPLIKTIREREDTKGIYIFTSSSLILDEAVKELGKEALEGIMFTGYHWDPHENIPQVIEFTKSFKENFHTDPTLFAATGYDAMKFLVTAIEDVNQQLPDDLRSQITKNAFTGILGETDFNKRGDVTRIPVVYSVHDGARGEITEEEINKIKEDVLTRLED
ncbi:Amino acid ABC transporter substrate-binding protein [Sulfidibacter corallicola]|uniref:Amino acid ABC transporter substrate-binding protein n=1 Tax=Sulfidibacter corallicola TaxID=2818388 RepID=A0A8A4U6B6_SULCO|nr:ABC transporter substrate-binding protein [Sulfidibacter corallicola]QTD54295.1 amino acid ABC transporter substrate-binding protein [Sulfidibacter corallicola]